MAEVKRAYRLLAKAFHPDSAGDAAIPRFLAIQEAYERLQSGRATSTPRPARAPTPPAAAPWRADPERARAARERARTAKSGAAGRTGRASTGTSGGGPTSSRGPGGAGATSGTGGATGGRRSGRRRDVRKATMGSTSYDEARDPSDATWSGASWYGPSSGEYWIVNPREYADPRKHGPEYQQRARRPLAGDGAGPEFGPATRANEPVASGASSSSGTRTSAAASAGQAASWASDGIRAPRTAANEAAANPAAAEPAAGHPTGRPGWARRAPDEPEDLAAGRLRPGEASPDSDLMDELGRLRRPWLGGQADDPIRRLGLALVAWPPIGLAAAAAIGDATGCSTYSSACGGSEPLLPWLAQAAILGLLLLLPSLARLLAGGAIGVLIALVPITALLVAVGGSGAPQAAPVMAALLAVAWLAGIGWSARSIRGRQLAEAAS